MKIKSAEFVTSAVQPSQYPPEELPEFAFSGRSNVGKSSLINTLVNRKKLVQTSSTPGKTRLVNFFRVNDALMLVDLPGYGYARVSEAERQKWRPMVEQYLSGRKTLKAVIVILDARRDPAKADTQLLDWLARARDTAHHRRHQVRQAVQDRLGQAGARSLRRGSPSRTRSWCSFPPKPTRAGICSGGPFQI